jgi:hypothetical protein
MEHRTPGQVTPEPVDHADMDSLSVNSPFYTNGSQTSFGMNVYVFIIIGPGLITEGGRIRSVSSVRQCVWKMAYFKNRSNDFSETWHEVGGSIRPKT